MKARAKQLTDEVMAAIGPIFRKYQDSETILDAMCMVMARTIEATVKAGSEQSLIDDISHRTEYYVYALKEARKTQVDAGNNGLPATPEDFTGATSQANIVAQKENQTQQSGNPASDPEDTTSPQKDDAPQTDGERVPESPGGHTDHGEVPEVRQDNATGQDGAPSSGVAPENVVPFHNPGVS